MKTYCLVPLRATVNRIRIGKNSLLKKNWLWIFERKCALQTEMKKTDLHVSAVNTSPMINGIASYHHSLPRKPFFIFLFFNLTTHLIFLTEAIILVQFSEIYLVCLVITFFEKPYVKHLKIEIWLILYNS